MMRGVQICTANFYQRYDICVSFIIFRYVILLRLCLVGVKMLLKILQSLCEAMISI